MVSYDNMIKKNLTVFILLIGCFVSELYSQDMLGITTSNNSGVGRAFINPAATIKSQKYFDILIVGGDIFKNNNYLYIPSEDYSFTGFFREDFPEYDGEPGKYFLDRYTQYEKYGFANIRLIGPSVMISYDEHSFSVHNSFRTIFSANNVPYDLAKFSLEGLDYSPQQNTRYVNEKPFDIGSLSWAELGVTYSGLLFDRWDESFSIGTTIKYLSAYHGFFIDSKDLDYESTDDGDLIVYRYNAEAGFSLPVDYQDNTFFGIESPVRGRGVSIDLGISYTRTIKPKKSRSLDWLYSQPSYSPYIYRIGFSILDIGFIHFNRNVRHLVFDNVSGIWEDINSVNFDNTDVFIAEMTEVFTEDDEELLQDSEFTVFLPSVASLQFDYRLRNNFYVQAIWMQDLPLIKPRISRPSYVGIVPRYETFFFEAALPVLVYHYRQPMLGLSLRFLYLTVGTENLGGLLGYNDFYGLDFYFSLQFNLDKGRLEETRCLIKQCFDHWR